MQIAKWAARIGAEHPWPQSIIHFRLRLGDASEVQPCGLLERHF